MNDIRAAGEIIVIACVVFQEERFCKRRFCKRSEEGDVSRGYGQQDRCIFWMWRVREWA